MERDHNDCERGYCVHTDAWWKRHTDDSRPEVEFGMYDPEGDVSGVASVVWETLDGKEIPKLECFDDGWSALSLFPDLIQEMGKVDSDNITPDDFIDLLERLNFQEHTEIKKKVNSL